MKIYILSYKNGIKVAAEDEQCHRSSSALSSWASARSLSSKPTLIERAVLSIRLSSAIFDLSAWCVAD